MQQVDYVSGGEAYFFTRGAVQRGTWQKASPEHPLKVYAADGSEVCFNRGKTYLPSWTTTSGKTSTISKGRSP